MGSVSRGNVPVRNALLGNAPSGGEVPVLAGPPTPPPCWTGSRSGPAAPTA